MFLYNSAMVAKTRKPKGEQLCIAVHITYNICDTDPLDIQDQQA